MHVIHELIPESLLMVGSERSPFHGKSYFALPEEPGSTP